MGSAIKLGIKKSKKKYVCIFMCDLSDDVNDIYKYYKAITDNNELDAVLEQDLIKTQKLKLPFFQTYAKSYSK